MRATRCLLLLLALASAACGPSVDLKTALQVEEISTGWLDVGIVNGQNKLVPSATFKLKNVSDQALTTLQANVIFRREGEKEEWGSAFVRVTGSEGLGPGASSELLSAHSQLGYTGTEPRQQMLENAQFVDARVQFFAKYGSTQWTLIAEHPVERRLITK
ncbi:MAG: hypothetical protein AB7Q29_08095 [Vicinamibacterales bacterium]